MRAAARPRLRRIALYVYMSASQHRSSNIWSTQGPPFVGYPPGNLHGDPLDSAVPTFVLLFWDTLISIAGKILFEHL